MKDNNRGILAIDTHLLAEKVSPSFAQELKGSNSLYELNAIWEKYTYHREETNETPAIKLLIVKKWWEEVETAGGGLAGSYERLLSDLPNAWLKLFKKAESSSHKQNSAEYNFREEFLHFRSR